MFLNSVRSFLRRPDPFAVVCYSENGEDRIAERLFPQGYKGVYVDIGAHHPSRFSVTRRLYENGWQGINVDPRKDMLKLFSRSRPRDINLQIGVSREKGTFDFYEYSEPTLNGLDPNYLSERHARHGFKIVDKYPVTTLPIREILSAHLGPGRKVDFLNVDVEGLELEVLSSNDWQLFRPSVLAVEQLDCRRLSEVLRTEIAAYLEFQGYEPVAMTVQTIFYKLGELIGHGPPE